VMEIDEFIVKPKTTFTFERINNPNS